MALYVIMSELTLTWVEAGITKSYRISLTMTRIGRDPARCDLVFDASHSFRVTCGDLFRSPKT